MDGLVVAVDVLRRRTVRHVQWDLVRHEFSRLTLVEQDEFANVTRLKTPIRQNAC